MNAIAARQGIYNVLDAARITGATPVHIRGWLLGYPQRRSKKAAGPILHRQHEPILGEFALGFLDLLEVRFLDRLVAACQRHGRAPSWRALRVAADNARTQFGDEHPFAARRLHSDGRTIFLEAQKETGDTALYDLVDNNFAIYDVLVDSFIATIEYVDGAARRWTPDESLPKIVIDPLHAFGRPIEAGSGSPVSALFDAWRVSDGNVQRVAAYFGADVSGVQQAIRYELGLGAPARRAA